MSVPIAALSRNEFIEGIPRDTLHEMPMIGQDLDAFFYMSLGYAL
jgi:hypothetical protein